MRSPRRAASRNSCRTPTVAPFKDKIAKKPELAGKTLGILGFGHIGEALARRARAFDMKVCAVRRQPQSDPLQAVTFIGGPERLDEVLGLSDYLAITLSLSPETRGLIDARRLGLMKSSAYLINVARAEIVDESPGRSPAERRKLFEVMRRRRVAMADLKFVRSGSKPIQRK